MITTLHIKNIGIINELTLDLNKGLNVLTGETGTGKTLIIDSLIILSGGRFSKEMIRKGETNSYIEASIHLPKKSDSTETNIIISREINNSGKNICKINGRLVTVNELKTFMSQIIEIHGQNQNQNLLDAKYHIKYLDNYKKGNQQTTNKYQEKYNDYKEIQKKLKQNYGDDKERERKLDLLKYQYDEIENSKLKPKEDEELENKRKIIINAEKISQNLQQIDTALGEGAIDSINTAIRALEKIENISPEYEQTSNTLKSIYYDLQEIAREISNKQQENNISDREIDEIEQRLDLIHTLKRKYGNTIEEILEYKTQIQKEIQQIENLEEYTKQLKTKQEQTEKELDKLADQIHETRIQKAIELSNKINSELEDLEMKNAKINIKVEKQNTYYENGKDTVTIYIKTNIGEDEKELSKIASGGETSRIMLGIKKVLAETDETPILIFDEIDTGISGKAANKVAQKLNHISKTHQVLCISHLPNIAAMADYHYYISKNITNQRTNTQIKQLNEKEKIKEIARISSGEINEISLKYATELRNKKQYQNAS